MKNPSPNRPNHLRLVQPGETTADFVAPAADSSDVVQASPAPSRSRRLGAFVAESADKVANYMTRNRRGSELDVLQVQQGIAESRSGHGISDMDNPFYDYVLDKPPLVSSRDAAGNRRRDLTHLILSGETVVGIVASGIENEGIVEPQAVDALVLPLGIHQIPAAENNRPVRKIGHIDMTGPATEPHQLVPVGRQELDDPFVSRQHYLLELDEEGAMSVTDTHSSAGTFVLEAGMLGNRQHGIIGKPDIAARNLIAMLADQPDSWDPDKL